jgi:hypothetical protein
MSHPISRCAKRVTGLRYRREGVSIGAQLVRPDIRQSSSADFWRSSRTSHTPAMASAKMMINPISAADLR